MNTTKQSLPGSGCQRDCAPSPRATGTHNTFYPNGKRIQLESVTTCHVNYMGYPSHVNYMGYMSVTWGIQLESMKTTLRPGLKTLRPFNIDSPVTLNHSTQESTKTKFNRGSTQNTHLLEPTKTTHLLEPTKTSHLLGSTKTTHL